MPAPDVKNINDNETELLQKVSCGDSFAFTLLVDAYWNNLYSQALAYVKTVEKAQEITQDVFLKIWQNREALQEVKDFKNYLFIVGKNYIISAMRKKLHHEEAPHEDLAEELWIPDKQLLYKEAYKKILQGIEKLPPTRQTIFRMSRLEGMSYHEIAQSLRISPNTVKGHIVLAISFLRNFIKEDIIASIFLICLINAAKLKM